MLRSATFAIGLVLAIGAFAAFVVLGTLVNPPPYQVVVALQDIPAYSSLEPGALGVDAQTMSSSVVRELVTRDELDQLLGGFTVETIRAGEPLRKSAIVTSGDTGTVSRAALMLNDPEQVGMIVPVDPKSAPEQIEAGDLVDLILSLTPGTINANNQGTFGSIRETPSVETTVLPRATPGLPAGAVLTATVLSAEEMNLPIAKVAIKKVSVLAVRRERIANPDFTVAPTNGETQSQPPAFVAGDIQSVLVRVPRTSVELLTFAMDNGHVHLSLLSPRLAKESGDSPTLGVSWNDMINWMMEERRRAGGQVLIVASGSVTPTATISPAPRPTRTAVAAQTIASPTVAAPTGISEPNRTSLGAPSDLFANLACFILPLGAGILLVLGAILFIRRVRS